MLLEYHSVCQKKKDLLDETQSLTETIAPNKSLTWKNLHAVEIQLYNKHSAHLFQHLQWFLH